MHVSGKIMLKSESVTTFIDVIVADVFSDNNEVKMMVAGEVEIGGTLLNDLREYDSMVFSTMILNYSMLVVSKDFDLDIDYHIENETIRIYIGIEDFDSTILTTIDCISLADLEPIDKKEVESLVMEYKSR